MLSPLLFLLYIDDLRSVVPETVKVALFADDVSLNSSYHNKQVAEKELQRAVTAVVDWSTSKKMVLNADICEVTETPMRRTGNPQSLPKATAFITTRCQNSSELHRTGC